MGSRYVIGILIGIWSTQGREGGRGGSDSSRWLKPLYRRCSRSGRGILYIITVLCIRVCVATFDSG